MAGRTRRFKLGGESKEFNLRGIAIGERGKRLMQLSADYARKYGARVRIVPIAKDSNLGGVPRYGAFVYLPPEYRMHNTRPTISMQKNGRFTVVGGKDILGPYLSDVVGNAVAKAERRANHNQYPIHNPLPNLEVSVSSLMGGDVAKGDYYMLNDTIEPPTKKRIAYAWTDDNYDYDSLEKEIGIRLYNKKNSDVNLNTDPTWVMMGINDDIAFGDVDEVDCVDRIRNWIVESLIQRYKETGESQGMAYDFYANVSQEELEDFMRKNDSRVHTIALKMLEDCREAIRRERSGEAKEDLPPLHFSDFLKPDFNIREYQSKAKKVPEISRIRRNIMGTTSFDLKGGKMRKPQDFIIYPKPKNDTYPPYIFQIQSDTRIGLIDMRNGRIIATPPQQNGAYGIHLAFYLNNKGMQSLGTLEESDYKALFDAIGASSQDWETEPSIIKSDNTGAGQDFFNSVKGREYERKKLKQ
tara:strand:+ start:1526 stop:2932 length:1407 start_codon:yes stop_codon:yes gene_type:complete